MTEGRAGLRVWQRERKGERSDRGEKLEMRQWRSATTWTLSCLSKGRADIRDHELYLRQQHPVPPQCEGRRGVWGSRGGARSQTKTGTQAWLLGGAGTSPHLFPLHLLTRLLLPLHILLSLAAAPYVLLQEECLHRLYQCWPGNTHVTCCVCALCLRGVGDQGGRHVT